MLYLNLKGFVNKDIITKQSFLCIQTTKHVKLFEEQLIIMHIFKNIL